MSLLDDVSIVVTPNGYKAGELYAVIPVPTEGAELVTNGDFATDSDWVKQTGWTISGGTANANVSGSEYIYQNISMIIGTTYKVTYDIVSYTSGQIRVEVSSTETGLYRSSVGTFTEYITPLSATLNRPLFRNTGGSGFVGSIDNVSVKEYTSADMDVTRATDATRVDENGLIADVLSGVPRIDYTGGGCPHILAEPQRTNLITYSEDFSQWTSIGTPTIVQNIISPDGTLNGTQVTRGSNQTPLRHSNVTTLNQEYTFSIYAKKGSVDTMILDIGEEVGASFTLTDDWQIFTVSSTPTTYTHVDINLGTSVSGDYIYIWGAQVEQGSYATSYIPTSGSTVTRNQDIFTRDGIGSLINSTEGVLFIEMAAFADYTTYRYMGLTDGSSDNRVIILYYNSSTRIRVLLSSGGTKYFDAYYAVTSIEDFHKVALKWKENDFALWIDGVERATDTIGLAPIGLNTLALDQAGGDNFFGKVKQLQVYKTALTDTQLAALTS